MARCRTYRYLLQPTERQRLALESLLSSQCELYNAALEERRGAWTWNRRPVTYVEQCRTLTELREVRPEVLDYGVKVCRGTLKRLDRAFQAFFRRCREGEKPGYPRFRPRSRFDSVQWETTSGWRLNEAQKRLRLLGVGHVKVRLHRPIRGVPKAITVRREGRRWFVSIRCVDVPAQPLPETGREVGVDLGVVNVVATSDGELIRGERFFARDANRLADLQRALSTKKRGSLRRRRVVERIAAHHRSVANRRRDLSHKLSRRLVNDYDLIVLEDLKVKNMVRRPRPKKDPDSGGFLPNGAAAKSGLNRSIADAGWHELRQMAVYKAESAGRAVRVVAAHHTSTTCAACGNVDKENRQTQAVFRCRACGHEAHADVNAARNILRAGKALRASAREGSK